MTLVIRRTWISGWFAGSLPETRRTRTLAVMMGNKDKRKEKGVGRVGGRYESCIRPCLTVWSRCTVRNGRHNGRIASRTMVGQAREMTREPNWPSENSMLAMSCWTVQAAVSRMTLIIGPLLCFCNAGSGFWRGQSVHIRCDLSAVFDGSVKRWRMMYHGRKGWLIASFP